MNSATAKSSRRVYRAWRAPLVTDPYGLARPRTAGPCEPPAWTLADVGLDVRDHVAADAGRSMWRIIDDNAMRHGYAWIDGSVVETTALPGGDSLRSWDTAYDASSMIGGARDLLDASLVKLAAIACARAVLPLVPAGFDAPRRAVDMAENVLRANEESWVPTIDSLQILAAYAVESSRGQDAASSAAHYAASAVTHTSAHWALVAATRAVENATRAAAVSIDLASVVRGVVPTRAVFDSVIAGWRSRAKG